MGSRASAQANNTKQGQKIKLWKDSPIGFRDEIHNITGVIL